MTRDELLAALRAIRDRQYQLDPMYQVPDIRGGTESDHEEADDLLLAYINDAEVTEVWRSLILHYD